MHEAAIHQMWELRAMNPDGHCSSAAQVYLLVESTADDLSIHVKLSGCPATFVAQRGLTRRTMTGCAKAFVAKATRVR